MPLLLVRPEPAQHSHPESQKRHPHRISEACLVGPARPIFLEIRSDLLLDKQPGLRKNDLSSPGEMSNDCQHYRITSGRLI